MIDAFLITLTGFFFLFVPAATLLSTYGIPVWLLVLVGRLLLVALVFGLIRNAGKIWAVVSCHRTLLVTATVFLGLQALYYLFYYTLPEWDTYGDLIRIRDMTANGTLAGSYRPLYYSAVSLLSQILFLPGYFTLLYVILPLHLTLILVAYRLLDKKAGYLWLLALVSVPVINMETGIIRPQSMLLIFTPVFIYFLLRWQQSKTNLWLWLSATIAILGLYYHEMFAFLLLALCLSFAVKKLREIARDRYRRQISLLSLALMVVTLMWLVEIIPSLIFVKTFTLSLISRVSNIANWKLWFLNSYGTDGVDIGWGGLVGVTQYYAYYVSPTMVWLALGLLLSVRKFKFNRPVDLGLLLTVLISYSLSEIFPRLGFVFLPERIWIIGNVILLLLMVRIAGQTTGADKTISTRWFTAGLLVAVVIGIGGSAYLAWSKKSLTNAAEMQAAEWLKTHTSGSAVVYSQPANWPLINFFAGRKINSDSRSVFLLPVAGTASAAPVSKESETADQIYNRIKAFNVEFGSTNQLLKDISSYRSMVSARKTGSNHPPPENAYILYSLQKFNNLYATRRWWLDSNYSGVDLEAMNTRYQLLYSHDGVYIWKLN